MRSPKLQLHYCCCCCCWVLIIQLTRVLFLFLLLICHYLVPLWGNCGEWEIWVWLRSGMSWKTNIAISRQQASMNSWIRCFYSLLFRCESQSFTFIPLLEVPHYTRQVIWLAKTAYPQVGYTKISICNELHLLTVWISCIIWNKFVFSWTVEYILKECLLIIFGGWVVWISETNYAVVKIWEIQL